MKRLWIIVTTVVVLAALGAGIGWYLGVDRLETVRGVVGSEKAPFFADQRVKDAFASHGLRVETDSRGSREMATTVPLDRYDFAFPGSAQAAQRVAQARAATGRFTPFWSPLAVATFTPVADLLAAEGVARRAPEGHWVLDLGKYLDLAKRDVRWDQLKGNVAYPARRDVLVTTTHPGDSNSAGVYAWLALQQLGGGANALDEVVKLFTDQGGLERSTEDPFEKYLAQGLNYTPLVLVYEAQYVDAGRAGTLPANATLLYLSPTTPSAHTVVAFDGAGDEVGRLIANDPELLRLAAEHGFRTADEAATASVLAQVPAGGAALPTKLADIVPAPAPEVVDSLLTTLDQRLRP
ncbi:hypothetical protein RB614_00580 [Phytohabitans sp. ZYX-F-186]|uniref:ABC transporter substrate-binding protein n=1 Tax=Phytohabitans maris TaxID=3071409 RepID=A0ABU0Z7I5_9ACTN|nr:hypothetical protein [Phytohabitans sp. ZYX-F-186]MDQ7903014.1 hypothetical protein [Phytohabitans sp. ZYX-F-186]